MSDEAEGSVRYTHWCRMKEYKGKLCRILHISQDKFTPAHPVSALRYKKVKVAILVDSETGEEIILEMTRGQLRNLRQPRGVETQKEGGP